MKLDEPIEGSSSLSIIVTPSGIEPSEVNSLPLPAKADSPTEVSLWSDLPTDSHKLSVRVMDVISYAA